MVCHNHMQKVFIDDVRFWALSFTPAAPPPPLSPEGHRMTTNMVPEGPKCAHRCYYSQREVNNQWVSPTTKYEVRPYPVPRAASETRFPHPRASSPYQPVYTGVYTLFYRFLNSLENLYNFPSQTQLYVSNNILLVTIFRER